MSSIDVYHHGKKVGELEVVEHIRLPFEPGLQTLLNLSLRSRGFLYQPRANDLVLEVRDNTLVAIANPRLGPGDLSLIKGFESHLDAYRPDSEMESMMKDLAPGHDNIGMKLDLSTILDTYLSHK